MAEVGWASLAVIPSFDGFQRNLEQGTRGPLSQVGASAGTTFGDVAGKRAGSRFGSAFKTAAKAGLVGIGALGAGAFALGRGALEEAREAQKIGAQTRAVLKSTGGAAKVTERSIGRLTGRLSDMAGVDDELIQNSANVILTFTKIRNEAGKGDKVFDRATAAALNMSTALGQDMRSASIQVGKALNDPVKGVTALGRAGVQFTEDQKEQIKTLVESGKTLDAQKMILRELDTQFKGSAKAQATEADKLGVSWGNLKEDLGTRLLPVMDDVAVFIREKGLPALEDFGDWFEAKGLPAIKDFADDMRPLAESALPAAKDALGAMKDALKVAAPFAKDLVDAFKDMPGWAKTALVGGGLGALGAKKLGLGKLGGSALGKAGQAFGLGGKGTPVYVTNWAQVGGGDGAIGGGAGKGGVVGKVALVAGQVSLVGGGAALQKSLGITPGTPGLPDLSSDEGKMRYAKTLYDGWNLVGDAVDFAGDKLGQVGQILGGLPDPIRARFVAPGLPELLQSLRDYDGILDGIDGRVVTTHIRTVTDNAAGDLGRNNASGIDGEGLGRTTVNNYVHNGDIRANDPRDYDNWRRNKNRARAGGKR